MSSNQKLIDSLTSRQIFIERYSKGEAKRLFSHLKRLSDTLKRTISKDYDRITAVRLARQISTLTEAIIKEFGADLTEGLTEFAKEEALFASQAVIAATSAEIINPASLNQIQAVLTKKKMSLLVGQKIQKLTVDEAISSFSKSKAKEVAQIIRDGATIGRTSQQIIADITGLVNTRMKHQAASLVRTTTNHMGGQARSATYAANDDVITGEEYVATLDSHTTISCSSLDGNIYPIGQGPMPPIHWSCRSVRTPVINPKYNLGADITGERASSDGPVSANTTYGGYLKRQSKAVQNEVLGKERATLFRSGKLSIGKFTDDTGKVYSLARLKELNNLT